jgi:uncharacterized protein
LDIRRWEEFCMPFYEGKDMMHDLTHIRRVLKMARIIAEPYWNQVDEEVLVAGAYFHGIIKQTEHREQILSFLAESGLEEKTKATWRRRKDR